MSGTKQWGRVCQLVVAPASGQNGLDLSELRITFRAKSRVTLTEPDTLEARVYNLVSDLMVLGGSSRGVGKHR